MKNNKKLKNKINMYSKHYADTLCPKRESLHKFLLIVQSQIKVPVHGFRHFSKNNTFGPFILLKPSYSGS